MKRKIFTALATAMFAMALIQRGAHAQDRLAATHRVQIRKVILRVRIAFETQEKCRNLFTKYGIGAQKALDRATFIYVGDALKPLGFAAATVVRTKQTLVGAGFYQNAADLDGMATVLIHELLHQQGAGPEIDNYAENYAEISNSCGTRNAA